MKAFATDPDAAAIRSPRPETIWYTRCPVPTASGIAIQKGWLDAAFSEEGVAVRSLRNSPTPETRESHYTHTLQNSFRQGGNGPALYAAAQGAKTVLLGLQFAPQYQGLLTVQGSGIRTVADLAGKRFAVPRRLHDKIDFWRATILQGYLAGLSLGGIAPDRAVWVDIPIEQTFFAETPAKSDGAHIAVPRLLRQQTPEVLALLRGEVDVIYGHSVWGVALREQFGLHEIINLIEYDDPSIAANNEQPVALTVSGELLERHPELVDRYVLELVRAARWARDHDAEAKQLLAVEMATAEYWMDEGTAPDVARRLDFSFDERLFRWLEARKDFMLAQGFLPRDFDLRSWADPRPLARALSRL